MKVISFLKKHIKETSVFCLFAFVILSSLVVGTSYATTSTYTRAQVQDQIVSAAISYLRNSYYSDYGQTSIDYLDEPDNSSAYSGNYYKDSTFLWRDISTSPESIGPSNYFHIDCSSFAFTISKNTVGYDMSYHANLFSNKLFFQENPENKMVLINGDSSRSKDRFIKGYKYFGKGWSTGTIPKIANSIVGNNNTGQVRNILTSTTSTSILAYQWTASYQGKPEDNFKVKSKVSDSTIKDQSDKLLAKWTGTILPNLQKGDIISFQRLGTWDASAGEYDSSGHAMVYVDTAGGYFDKKTIIHSAGKDYVTDEHGVDGDAENRLNNDTSVRNSAVDSYIQGQIKEKKLKSFIVLRPANTICKDGVCIPGNVNNANNIDLSATQISNNEARVALKNTRVYQFANESKSYKDLNGNAVGETQNRKSRFNSINVGDQLNYRIVTSRKASQGSSQALTITANVPSGATYVSCTNSCTVNADKTVVTWKNVKLVNVGDSVANSFTVKADTTGKLTFGGFKVTTSGGKVLQLSDLITRVNPTQNGVNRKILDDTITAFKNAVGAGKIVYNSAGTAAGDATKDISSLSADNPTEISSLGFVKMIYYNAFGLDFDSVTGSFGKDSIRTSVFNKLSYPAKSNFTGKEYVGDKTANVFGKKISTIGYDDLTAGQKKIYSMAVPGLYGGKHVKGFGSASDIRIKFLRAFNNSDDYYNSDLEPGDIIVVWYNNATSSYAYIYGGNDSNGPVLYRFTSSGVKVYTDKYLSSYFTNKSYSSDRKPANQVLNELFSKNLFAVLRPSIIGTTVSYNYDSATVKSDNNYVAYDTYKNLAKPKKAVTITYNYNGATGGNSKTSDSVNLTFDGWYSDSTLTNKVTNSSKLVSSDNHTLYAKWSGSNIILPTPTKIGYMFSGWYSDSSLTKAVTSSDISKTMTLYAGWNSDDYYVEYNANGGSGSMAKTTHSYGTSSALAMNSFVRSGYVFSGWATSATGSVVYHDGEKVKDLTSDGKTITLYAVWIKDTTARYDVSVKITNGIVNVASQKVVAGSSGEFIIAPNSGYGNPSVSCTNNQKGVISDEKLVVSNVTFSTVCTVSFSAKNYSISYDLKNGSLTKSNPSSYNITSSDITLNNPVKNISIEINDNGTGATISSNVSTSLTFAGWTGSNGDIAVSPLIIKKGSIGNKSYVAHYKSKSINLPSISKENSVCYFNTSSDNSGKKYTASSLYTIDEDSPNKITLYAICGNDYTITYDLDGGSFVDGEVNFYTSLTETFTLPIPEKEGYEFIGWTGSNGTIPSKEVVITKGSTGNKNYVANYEENKYTLTFNAMGGNIDSKEFKVAYQGKLPDVSSLNPSYPGYKFMGWQGTVVSEDEETTTIQFYDSTGKSNSTYDFTNSIELVAMWSPVIYTITFDNLGGIGGPSNISALYNRNMNSLSKYIPKKFGYIFLGFFDDKDFTKGKRYFASDGTSLIKYDKTSNITLYAGWAPNNSVKLSSPSEASGSSVNYNTVKLKWDKVEYADGYKVYKYNYEAKKYVLVTKTSKTTVNTKYDNVTGVKSYYLVNAYKNLDDGRVVVSDVSNLVSVVPKLNKTKLSKVIAYSNNYLYLKWKKIEGASGYKIYKYSYTKKKYVLIRQTKYSNIITKYGVKKNKSGIYKIKSYRTINDKNVYSDDYKIKIYRR